MKAIVLAAGRGERMRPLTDSLPKPLAPVAGKPLIGYHLESLARAGIRDVVINLSWLGGQIRAALGDGSAYGLRIHYSDEGPTALETGGGIFNALPQLGPDPFLAVNGDTWTDLDFGELALAPDADAHLILVNNPPHLPKGDFGLEGDRIVERQTERFTYSGFGVYRPEFFAGCSPGKFPMMPLFKRAIAAGRLSGELYRGEWFEIGTMPLLAEMDARMRARIAAASVRPR
jgi:MurNAc alpha-1-phosphate uridylyltransferase